MAIKCHIKKTSVLSGQIIYFVGNSRWSDNFEDRKIFSSLTSANSLIAPIYNVIGGTQGPNANGGFKNAQVVKES